MKSLSDQLFEALTRSPEPAKQIEALEKIPEQYRKHHAEQEQERIIREFYD